MHPQLAAYVRRHDVPPDQAAELEALFSGHLGGAVTWAEPDPDATVEDGGGEPSRGEVSSLVAGRYQDLGPIGTGGMGEVRRVRDLKLNRTLAMKRIHPRLAERPRALARFVEEAQATAQLQHPNILPVHDLGTLPDGRVWFTMKEVHGRTLAEIIAEVHEAADWRFRAAPSGWTFKRLVASFLAVCRALAFAHERGVVHRDLKPDNVMVGRHGETWVLDWGLAKVLGRPVVDGPGAVAGDEGPVVVTSGSHPTRVGVITGTPAYMAPEQARGQVDRIDARTDVYALGAILHALLTGRQPYEGPTAQDVIVQVREGPPPPPSAGPALPPELVSACLRAMARDPEARFATAMALADEVEAWLDGARRREQALRITERALHGVQEAQHLLGQAEALQAEGDDALAGIEVWRPEADKAAAWALQDRAASLRRAADLRQLAVDQGLHGALQVAPDLPEAHAALAERYRACHALAEQARDADETARCEASMRPHVEALPEGHETRARLTAWLQGDGALSLVTDPASAEVELFRYETRNRRLVEVPVGSLGTTPLHAVQLPMGSYLAVLRHPDCDAVRYPFEVGRQAHWDGIAPGDSAPTPIWLPARGSLGDDEVLVPAGWFRFGGDPEAPGATPGRRLWCDALVVQRFPVTNRAYLAFLDDLVARGRTDDALRHVPRERAAGPTERGAMIYGFDGTRFSLVADADGDRWQPDWPALMVDWHGARAYLAWLAERTGQPWRLPLEREWEKAARGVDGRWYPWGDATDPSWCNMGASHRGRRMPTGVDTFPIDTSPCGLRGAGGNVYDWCLDPGDPAAFRAVPDDVRVAPPAPIAAPAPPGPRMVRGGSWQATVRFSRVCNRGQDTSTNRHPSVGFRGVYRPDPDRLRGQDRA